MKITIVGIGYVGLSLAILLSKKFNIFALDIDIQKVNLINRKISPIADNEINDYLSREGTQITATTDSDVAYDNSKIIIIATSTNYDSNKGSFDTTNVESVIADISKKNNDALIVIKSTVPIGFTDKMRNKFKNNEILFSPEFLREGRALYDNLYPSRIVIGSKSAKAMEFGKILLECSNYAVKEINTHYIDSKEAEAVKLFSNTYLAMRISFFNELDTFSEANSLSTENIINAVCDDSRIGNYYNNPSFGYGGYCLPKDTKQLLDDYHKTPNDLIKAVIDSNETRKIFISKIILKKNPKIVGIYRLTMKENSDNFRESAVLDIIKILKKNNVKINLYEPYINDFKISDVSIFDNLEEFIAQSDLIIANRMTEELMDIREKVYSRDIFGQDL